MEKHIVEIKKLFVDGTLEGITVDVRCSFPNRELALYFAEEVNELSRSGLHIKDTCTSDYFRYVSAQLA